MLAVTQDRGVLYKNECEQNYVSPSGDLSGLKLVRENDYIISLRSFQEVLSFPTLKVLFHLLTIFLSPNSV